jgi:hypothetical protein
MFEGTGYIVHKNDEIKVRSHNRSGGTLSRAEDN